MKNFKYKFIEWGSESLRSRDTKELSNKSGLQTILMSFFNFRNQLSIDKCILTLLYYHFQSQTDKSNNSRLVCLLRKIHVSVEFWQDYLMLVQDQV